MTAMAILSDNEVAYVAEMQAKIDTYEGFIACLSEIISGRNAVSVVYADTFCTDMMADIQNFVEEAARAKK